MILKQLVLKLENYLINFKKLIKIIFFIDNEDSINFGLIPSSFLAKINKTKSEIINLHWLGMRLSQLNRFQKSMVV